MLFLHFGSRQDICSWKTGMRAGFTGLVPPSESTEESCPPQLGPVWLFLDCHVQNSLRNWCGVFRESLQKRRGERASAALPGMCVAWTWTLQCEAIKNMHLRRFINVPEFTTTTSAVLSHWHSILEPAQILPTLQANADRE